MFKQPKLPIIRELIYVITSRKMFVSPVSYSQKQVADKLVYTFDVSHRSVIGQRDSREAEMAYCPILRDKTLELLLAKNQEEVYPKATLRIVGLGLGHHLAMRLCADLLNHPLNTRKPNRLSLVQPLFQQYHLYSKSSLEALKELSKQSIAIDIYRSLPVQDSNLCSYDSKTLHQEVYPCLDLEPIPSTICSTERCLNFYMNTLCLQPGEITDYPHAGMSNPEIFSHYGYHYKQMPFIDAKNKKPEDFIDDSFTPSLKKDLLSIEHTPALCFSEAQGKSKELSLLEACKLMYVP